MTCLCRSVRLYIGPDDPEDDEGQHQEVEEYDDEKEDEDAIIGNKRVLGG
jgi:hypothetical protein